MSLFKGTANNDTLKGGGDNDVIYGYAGNDLVYGYAGTDRAFLGAGNDTFIWHAGEGNDTISGGSGLDTLRYYADDQAEAIQVGMYGASTHVYRNVDLTKLDLDGVERIDLRAGGGADSIIIANMVGGEVKQVAIDLAGMASGVGDGAVDAIDLYGTIAKDVVKLALVNNRVTVGGLPAQVTIANPDANDTVSISAGYGNDVVDASSLQAGHVALKLNGGRGNDYIAGSKGSDTLEGNIGNDTIVGGKGADGAWLGSGNDLFLWQMGDGVDAVFGESGFDTVRATTSKASDAIDIYLLGGTPVVATGNEGVITDGVERMQVRALGGADHIDIGDLTGSDVQSVEIDLAATAGGALADTNADTVTRYGTSVNDIVDIRWTGNKVVVGGLSATVSVAHAGTNDTIIVDGASGNDILNAATMPTGKARLRLLGDLGDDVIFGGAGNDTVVGGLGNDATFMGAGNDLYSWNAGDGADRVEGQAGTDTIVLNGQAVSESFDVAVAGNQVNVNTNSGLIDLDDVERIRIQGFAGTDMITVRNYAGTDVKQLAIDLGLAGGADDSASDYVIGLGSSGNDQITLTTSSTGVVSMTGFAAQVTVSHAGVGDSIQLITFGGDDVINTATMPASSPNLSIDVGQGDDKVTGGAGKELISGGLGHDTLRGGGGDDYLYGEDDADYLDGGSGIDYVDGGAGDDVIVGGKGDDTLWGGAGDDTFRYTSKLDGRDLIADFDGDAAGGQDTLNLDALFDALGIANGSRAGLVELIDNGANVEVKVNADGNAGNGFELQVAILNTADTISVGQDIVVAA